MCNDGENSIIDKIVVICSVLCNYCNSVIPFKLSIIISCYKI